MKVEVHVTTHNSRYWFFVSIAAVVFVVLLTTSCGTVVEPVIPPDWDKDRAQRPLTHADCVQLALESAPTAAAWRARLAMATAALKEAASLPNPTFTGSFEDFALPGPKVVDPLQMTFSLAYAINEILQQPDKESAATADLRAARAELMKDAQLLAAETCRMYDRLLFARRRVTLESDLETASEKQSDAAHKFASEGVGSRLDVERAEAELVEARVERAKAEREAREFEIEFSFALGFRRWYAIELADGPTTTTDVVDDLEALLRSTTFARPEVLAADAHYEAALVRARLESKRLKFLPTVSPGYRRLGRENRGIAELSVELPIFNSGEATEAQSSAELLAAAAEARSAAAKITNEVTRAVFRVNATREFRDGPARELVERRVRLHADTERLFLAGESALQDVILAARDAVNARLRALDADQEAAAASVEFNAAMGRYAPVPQSTDELPPTSAPTP